MKAKQSRRWVRTAVVLGVFVLGLGSGWIASAFSAGGKFGDLMLDQGAAELMAELNIMAMYHQGDEAGAIELLEKRVNSRIVNISGSMSFVRAVHEHEPLTKAMRIARLYRETYPYGGRQAENVDEALKSVAPITSEEPWMMLECEASVCKLIEGRLVSRSGPDADNS